MNIINNIKGLKATLTKGSYYIAGPEETLHTRLTAPVFQNSPPSSIHSPIAAIDETVSLCRKNKKVLLLPKS